MWNNCFKIKLQSVPVIDLTSCFGVRLGYGYETWSNVLLSIVGLFFLIYVFYYYKWMKVQRIVRFSDSQVATQGCATYTQRQLRTGQFLMFKKIVGIGFSCRLNSADEELMLMKENEQEVLKKLREIDLGFDFERKQFALSMNMMQIPLPYRKVSELMGMKQRLLSLLAEATKFPPK